MRNWGIGEFGELGIWRTRLPYIPISLYPYTPTSLNPQTKAILC